MPVERVVGVSVHDGRIWFKLWDNPNEWGRADPWWWRFSFGPIDFLLGQERYSEIDVWSGRVVVLLPEGEYPAGCKIYDAVRRRPRWPWARRVRRARIEPDVPIPVPGKGENVWDCGDDAVWWTSVPAGTAAEGVEKMVEDVLRTRERYGGKGWVAEHPVAG
jgi:hypothetical protein